MNRVKEIISILVVACFFVAASVFANQYRYPLQEIIFFKGYIGILLYIVITTVAVVIAPISTFPFLPLAVSLWGSVWAALFSITGWVIGASVAFGLARRFGRPFIEKMVSLEKIQRIEKFIPKRNIFLSVVMLRMSLPVDVLSYALGLFSSVPFKLYFFATLIGVIPFAFIFSYAVLLPVWINAVFFFFAIAIAAIGYKRWYK